MGQSGPRHVSLDTAGCLALRTSRGHGMEAAPSELRRRHMTFCLLLLDLRQDLAVQQRLAWSSVYSSGWQTQLWILSSQSPKHSLVSPIFSTESFFFFVYDGVLTCLRLISSNDSLFQFPDRIGGLQVYVATPGSLLILTVYMATFRNDKNVSYIIWQPYCIWIFLTRLF